MMMMTVALLVIMVTFLSEQRPFYFSKCSSTRYDTHLSHRYVCNPADFFGTARGVIPGPIHLLVTHGHVRARDPHSIERAEAIVQRVEPYLRPDVTHPAR